MTHAVVAAEEWLAARKELLAKEKEFTRLRDQVSALRRELPRERFQLRLPRVLHPAGARGSQGVLQLRLAGSWGRRTRGSERVLQGRAGARVSHLLGVRTRNRPPQYRLQPPGPHAQGPR